MKPVFKKDADKNKETNTTHNLKEVSCSIPDLIFFSLFLGFYNNHHNQHHQH